MLERFPLDFENISVVHSLSLSFEEEDKIRQNIQPKHHQSSHEIELSLLCIAV